MSEAADQIESITVVGGGDAGLLNALALQKGLDTKDIVVVDDFDAPVPEVGKSTLGNVVTFLHESLEIDPGRLWDAVDFSFKTTVYFEDWCGVDSFHSPLSFPVFTKGSRDTTGSSSSISNLTPEHETEFHEYYYRYEATDFSDIYGEVAETPGKTPLVFDTSSGAPRPKPDPELTGFSYHFDSTSLNDFLRTLCAERGVELVDDRITDVSTADGRIESITGDRDSYPSDLYVDASGFKRLLTSELDAQFVAFDLPVDRALVTKTDIPLSEVVSATVVTSGDAGWFWQIDTFGGNGGSRDLGYVYSSAHITDEDAKAEFVATRDEDIDSEGMRQYQFDSGVVADPWQANCVAVGNAQGFVEPLQSTALSTHCKLATNLTRGIAKHGRMNCEGVRKLYNGAARDTWDEVYDFVSVYYTHNSGSTAFWEDARATNPGELDHYRTYQESGLSAWQELTTLTRTGTDLNGVHLYYLIFRSLGVESAFYENLDREVDQAVAEKVQEGAADLSDRVETLASYDDLVETFPNWFGNAS